MNILQHQAADPSHSVWVLASAGTGKTKILTDRVLRLLLSGVDFSKILCLTFTNAGASEMLLRINNKLIRWSNCTENELAEELNLLLGRVERKLLIRAKDLYRIFLNLPHKIHIYTIHSFCQKILKRFPLEAGLAPSFQIIDDIILRKIIHKARDLLYSQEANRSLIEFFASNFHELIIDEIFEDILNQKLRFKRYFSTNPEADNSEKIQELGLEKNKILITLTYDLNKFCALAQDSKILQEDAKLETLYNKIKLYSSLRANDSERGNPDLGTGKMDCRVDSKESPRNEERKFLDLMQHIFPFFLTKTGDKRVSVISKKLANNYPQILSILTQIQDSVYEIDQIIKTQKVYNYTNLLLNLAKSFLEIYESYKSEYSLLDYDDLIYHTNNLLKSSDAKDWVLYKLDGGIDHILVDESQDTSLEQWQIIQNLIEEFYSGQGVDKNNRSIFVVGDEKQSIFSFQGADLEMFYMMNQYFEDKLRAARKEFKIIKLEYSYRSAPAILESVYNIFSYIKQRAPDSFIANNPAIIPFRDGNPGFVELWPLVTSNKIENFFWQGEIKPEEHEPYKKLAVKIALYIRKQITDGVILSSTGMVAKAGDFLILVRTRDEFTNEVINQLETHDVPVAGIDRMIINENLSVMDLLSIAKFVLTPFDDLNLASLLKSPVVGFSDRQIADLLLAKPKEISLWDVIKEWADSHPELDSGSTQSTNEILSQAQDDVTQAHDTLNRFINLYQITNAGDFFHYILDYLGYREILVNSNAADNTESINEFLYLASKYANDISSSLQDFVYWFEEHEIEIKRSITPSNKVRIMTVHSSKGLEAPIVILCDTTSMPVGKHKFFWDQGGLMASMSSSIAPKMLNEVKEKYKQKEFEEYLRLFYVALTRPCDHLIICGYYNQGDIPDSSWYSLAKSSMQNFARTNEDGTLVHGTANEISGTNLQNCHPELNSGSTLPTNEIGKSSQDDVSLTSHVRTTYTKINSPLIPQDNLKYGQIFHKLLEDSIKIKQVHKMHTHPLLTTLSIDLQERIRHSIDNLLINKEFIELLNSEVKTEVNIGAEVNGKYKIGRIDLLSLTDNNVTIIDYKSDINPPKGASPIPQTYIKQLQSYKEVISSLYPSLPISCKILWLQSGEFSEIYEKMPRS
jgi:ATP-dependent helicase/nuclease subunit A